MVYLAMETKLSRLEQDFIEFISHKRNRSYGEIEENFLKMRNRFMYKGKKYTKFCGDFHAFYKILYDNKDECGLIEANKFYSFLHMFNYLSYTYPKSTYKNIQEGIRYIKKREFASLYFYTKRKIMGRFQKVKSKSFSPHERIANFLVERINTTPTVVDYGSGLAYVSFEIARIRNKAKIYLVDIDCLHLEFAVFRFKKHGFNIEVIKVTEDNMYPKLPEHNICIATEVMEHVFQPLTVYRNIIESLDSGGILYGNFADHQEGMFHVSPDLRDLRERINQNFDQLDLLCYKRRK